MTSHSSGRLHELEGIAVGLDPQVIDVVRNRQPLTGVGENESVIMQIGREIFGEHELSSETYARALRVLGEANLVDIVGLMGSYTTVGTRLTAFNQPNAAWMEAVLTAAFHSSRRHSPRLQKPSSLRPNPDQERGNARSLQPLHRARRNRAGTDQTSWSGGRIPRAQRRASAHGPGDSRYGPGT